jgi:hypothetical protein
MATTPRIRLTSPWSFVATLVLLTAPLGAVQAQDKDPQDKSSTVGDVKEVASQPVRDVGIEKTKIPPLLVEVSDAPYGMGGAGTCRQIAASIADLTDVLGPDYTGPQVAKKQNIAKVGGAAVVNSLIPFRGLVREVSGAGPAERRLQAAVAAGVARRGFLRGLQSARGCRS